MWLRRASALDLDGAFLHLGDRNRRHLDLEHAVLESRDRVLGLHVLGNPNPPIQTAVGTLGAIEALVFLFFRFSLTFPFDRQLVVSDLDPQVLLLQNPGDRL